MLGLLRANSQVNSWQGPIKEGLGFPDQFQVFAPLPLFHARTITVPSLPVLHRCYPAVSERTAHASSPSPIHTHTHTHTHIHIRVGGPHTEKRKDTTVSQQFRESLELLMLRMGACEPHFIRCIKPNTEKRAGVYGSLLLSAS